MPRRCKLCKFVARAEAELFGAWLAAAQDDAEVAAFGREHAERCSSILIEFRPLTGRKVVTS